MKHAKQAGFTLLELIVVLAILATIMGFLGKGIIDRGETAKVNATKIHISQIGQSLDVFKIEVGRYPTSGEGLAALITAPGGVQNWSGPYLKENGGALPKDPWGAEYRYASPNATGGYDLISLGSDGKEGGEATAKDISNAK